MSSENVQRRFDRYFPALKRIHDIAMNPRTIDYGEYANALEDVYKNAIEGVSDGERREFDGMLTKKGIDIESLCVD